MHTHLRYARGWIAILAILVLIAAHVWLFTVSRAHVSLALAAGVLAVVVVKFAWWTSRHQRRRGGSASQR